MIEFAANSDGVLDKTLDKTLSSRKLSFAMQGTLACANRLHAVFTAKRSLAPIWLVLACLCLFLPGFFTLPPMDRDEPRFAQASKQMLESGDYVAISFQDTARNKKPVGVYWLQAGTVALAQYFGLPEARVTIWLYRVPSLFGAIFAVLLTYWLGCVFLHWREAMLAALLLACCVLLGVEARLAKTDALLTATVVASFIPLARRWLLLRRMQRQSETQELSQEQAHESAPIPQSPNLASLRLGRHKISWGDFVLFWAAIAVGVLLKGPVGLMIVALALLVLCTIQREFSWLLALRPLLGALFVGFCAVPWLVLIGVATHGAFFNDALGQDMLAKVAGGQELHGAPPGTYALVGLITGWPFMPLFLCLLPVLWRLRHAPEIQCLAAWLVPSWLVFELVPTKLPHYVLPLYPAMALSCLYALQHGLFVPAKMVALANNGAGALQPPSEHAPKRWQSLVLWLVPLIGALPIFVVFFWFTVAFTLRHKGEASLFLQPALYALLTLLIANFWLGFQARRCFLQRTFATAMSSVLMAALCLVLAVYAIGVTSEAMEPMRLSERLRDAVKTVAVQFPTCRTIQISSVDDHEPSLVFLLGTDLRLDNADAAARFMAEDPAPVTRQSAQKPCRLVLLGAAGQQGAVAAGLDLNVLIKVGHVVGMNINTGKTLDITLYLRLNRPLP